MLHYPPPSQSPSGIDRVSATASEHEGRASSKDASDERANDPIARKHYLGDDFRM